MNELTGPPRSDWRPWLRGTLITAGCVAVVGVFSAGSCHTSFCSGEGCWYHDDDDDFDDDDAGAATSGVGLTPSYRLEEFDLVTATTSGAHPAARLDNIRGISLAHAEGSELSDRELEQFTRDLLDVNRDLIGLPASAGTLAFDRVETAPTATIVHWRQLRDRVPVPGAGTAFEFDLIGRLVAIDNRTRL